MTACDYCPFRGCPTCPNQGTDDHTEVDGQLTIYDALGDNQRGEAA